MAKFLLGELQKEHYRSRLAAQAIQAEQQHPEASEEQLQGGDTQSSKVYNGFTLYLKDQLQAMAS